MAFKPYENDDTRLWTLERKVQKTEMALDSIEHRLDRIEENIREMRSTIFNHTLFFGVLIVVSNGIIGALL
jgi:SMC interacting uncharacterized protein involved in chromosome segregation